METKIKLLENEKQRIERDFGEKVTREKEEKEQKAKEMKLKALLVSMFTTTDFDVRFPN